MISYGVVHTRLFGLIHYLVSPERLILLPLQFRAARRELDSTASMDFLRRKTAFWVIREYQRHKSSYVIPDYSFLNVQFQTPLSPAGGIFGYLTKL